MATLTNVIKDYALVREYVVRLTKTKTNAYWNSVTDDELLTEHTKHETVFRRKLASGFIKMLDKKVTRSFNSTFGQKQLMESLFGNTTISELSGYPKALWGTFLLEWISQTSTGVGYDYLRQVGVSGADGNIRLLYDATAQGGNIFQLYCDSENGTEGVIPNGTVAKLRVSFCSINYDDPNSSIPNVHYIEIDTQVANGSQGFVIPFPAGTPIGLPDTYTYVLARIEFFAQNDKGVLKSKDKGLYDTLQVVGCRL